MGTPKLLFRFDSPFQVCKLVGRDAYEVVLSDKWRIHDTFHVSQLAEYHNVVKISLHPQLNCWKVN